MARFPAQRRGNALVPTTQDGRDVVNKLEHGSDVMVSVTPARNVRQFRLFWALCGVVAEHYEVAKEAIKDELLRETGHVEPVFYRDGSMRIEAKSVAWENMPPDEFDAFFKLAIAKVCEWLGSAPKELRDHVLSMVDSPPLAPRMRTRQTEPAE